ncbi:GNAT family N-acetyltransferase [Rehaibacterium terrae]|jgi:GNAT superfamily N-acetyltransferase|uniref:GNAT superfamily N-acetyltransferase n=1 Tax=Rehaibacterium terrae TaxID=1341696 RepID=A0A7W7XZY5_9GAMM|nr:GNAT family N-acetyltransferase [Rehaibacterium terrae]MBB5015533.1 GNAT superfamily N-acetyltransferase [Rehaibacterium terrae]
MPLSIERLDAARHDRADFHCGVPSLDRYLHELAAQHQRRRVSTTYVLIDSAAPRRILGYYTLSFGALRLDDLPPAERRKLPRHPVPAARMGRLAVDEAHRGRGYGELLLQNAVKRCLAAGDEIACYALAVDALDDSAARFYERYGFSPCDDGERQWYLPLGRVG